MNEQKIIEKNNSNKQTSPLDVFENLWLSQTYPQNRNRIKRLIQFILVKSEIEYIITASIDSEDTTISVLEICL